MPKKEKFWNPYRFVPVREKSAKRAPYTDERFQGMSGSITCTLINLSLLFIGGGVQGQTEFINKRGRPVLPGSSLKGMLRSLAEIVGGGCFVHPEDLSCNDANNLCITCRMFGMLYRDNVHKGQISVSDGELQDSRPSWKQVSLIQGQPKKGHAAFYKHPLTGEHAKDMMKMYFHQPQKKTEILPIPANLRDRAVTKQMLEPGHHFKFIVHFENLAEEELNLLLYVLALEEEVKVSLKPNPKEVFNLHGPMRHKLGNAKGQGPGSCQIVIEKIVYQPEANQRFLNLTASRAKELTGDELKQEIDVRTKEYKQGADDSYTMQYLRKIMVWDETDNRIFGYPDFSWFRDAKNKDTELKPIYF